MTDDTDERGEEYVARQRGGDSVEFAAGWEAAAKSLTDLADAQPTEYLDRQMVATQLRTVATFLRETAPEATP
jgi:hypothetical protein